jgi:hypothetical protein
LIDYNSYIKLCDTASEEHSSSSAFFDSEILNEGSNLAQPVPVPLVKPATFLPSTDSPSNSFLIKNLDTGEYFDLRDSYVQSVLVKELTLPNETHANLNLWHAA